MSKAKKIWRGESVYARLLAERERDGLTLAELSERSGVPVSTLQRWGRRLRSGEEVSPRRFVEFVPATRSSEDERVEIGLCSGRTLRISARPPFTGLADLVRLLETC